MAQNSGLGVLGKLPQELRHQVFEAYFEDGTIENRGPNVMRDTAGYDNRDAFVLSRWVNDYSTALLVASKAVHAEAVHIEARSDLRLNLKSTDRRPPPPKLAARVTSIYTTSEGVIDYAFLKLDDYPALKYVHNIDKTTPVAAAFVANTTVREGEVTKALTGGHDADIINDLLDYNNLAKLLERKKEFAAVGLMRLVHSRLPCDHVKAAFEYVTGLFSDPKLDMVSGTL